MSGLVSINKPISPNVESGSLQRWRVTKSLKGHKAQVNVWPGPEVIKLFSCSTQLRLKFILLRNVKMPTIVGILTFISRINYRLW